MDQMYKMAFKKCNWTFLTFIIKKRKKRTGLRNIKAVHVRQTSNQYGGVHYWGKKAELTRRGIGFVWKVYIYSLRSAF